MSGRQRRSGADVCESLGQWVTAVAGQAERRQRQLSASLLSSRAVAHDWLKKTKNKQREAATHMQKQYAHMRRRTHTVVIQERTPP